jgi:carboxymethylenebutenolidase
MHERQLDIETKDGRMSTFVVHPERGGPYPVILFAIWRGASRRRATT